MYIHVCPFYNYLTYWCFEVSFYRMGISSQEYFTFRIGITCSVDVNIKVLHV